MPSLPRLPPLPRSCGRPCRRPWLEERVLLRATDPGGPFFVRLVCAACGFSTLSPIKGLEDDDGVSTGG